MKNLMTLIIFFVGLNLIGQKIQPSEVKQLMKKVADWQIENHDNLKYRAQKFHKCRG